MKRQLLTNARIVLENTVEEQADLLIENGMITAIGPTNTQNAEEVNLQGCLLTAGLIDLHCDALEKEAEPRPGVHFPFELASALADKRNAVAGITTVYHALSFANHELGVRNNNVAADLARAMARMEQLAEQAGHHGIPLASHDDDSPEKVAVLKGLGARISEFPINLETAVAARESGLSTLFGAPNILRNASQSGNMKAIYAVQQGVADCLCSDYSPAALLPAVMHLVESGQLSLPQAFALVTRNPARAAGLDDRGVIAPGKRADLIAITGAGLSAHASHVWSRGQEVLRWQAH